MKKLTILECNAVSGGATDPILVAQVAAPLTEEQQLVGWMMLGGAIGGIVSGAGTAAFTSSAAIVGCTAIAGAAAGALVFPWIAYRGVDFVQNGFDSIKHWYI